MEVMYEGQARTQRQQHYLELATELLHQRVAVQHHASADLLSHTCQSKRVAACHTIGRDTTL